MLNTKYQIHQYQINIIPHNLIPLNCLFQSNVLEVIFEKMSSLCMNAIKIKCFSRSWDILVDNTDAKITLKTFPLPLI